MVTLTRRGAAWALKLTALLGAASLARAANIPIDTSFEYAGYARTLYYHVHADAEGKAVTPANKQVIPGDGGYIEPIGLAGGGPNTIGNAFRRAAETWNAAMAGMSPRWTLVETNQDDPTMPPLPHIHVRMSGLIPGENPGDPPREELLPVPSTEAPFDGERPKNQSPPANNRALLAFFRLLAVDAQGRYTSAEIVFNRNVDWGIDQNSAPNVDLFYDPIIVALHEIGHAFKLDHDPDANNDTVGKNAMTVNGNIMRPFLASGTHNTNPTNPMDLSANYARNPSAMDIAAAKASAAVPEPTTLALALAGASCAALGRCAARARRAAKGVG
jgi:hypothetical protein